MKKTICKVCSKNLPPVYGYRKCYSCRRSEAKFKKEERLARAKQRKLNSKGFQAQERKKLHAKAWGLMSKVVRLKDANADGYVQCYTCDTIKHYKEMDAGHFHHNKLDFDFRNLRPQCDRCNRSLSGNHSVYGTNLAQEIGAEGMQKLLLDSNAISYDKEALEAIIEDLEGQLRNLNN